MTAAGAYSVHMKLGGVDVRPPAAVTAVFTAAAHDIAKCNVTWGLVPGQWALHATAGASAGFALLSADSFGNPRV